MADTVLEGLEEELGTAFKEFAQNPTQSARIKLRSRLQTLAGALEVEANNMDEAEAATLLVGITDLRALAEMALVAPKELLILQSDTPVPLKEQEKRAAPRIRGGAVLGRAILRDVLRLFKQKRSW